MSVTRKLDKICIYTKINGLQNAVNEIRGGDQIFDKQNTINKKL